MKLSIEGSSLANRLKPLATPVRQHEGRDYDKMVVAIVDEDGKKYLNACVMQPSYMAYMHLNLSGRASMLATGETPPVGAEPIDADAVACGDKEKFVLKATDMVNVNRNVNRYLGNYIFTEDGLTVTIEDAALFRKPCKRVMERLNIPHCYERELTPAEAVSPTNYRLMGSLGENSGFCDALDTAIRMCRLSGSKGVLKTQAIHISLSAERMKVEAVSGNGAVVFSSSRDVCVMCKDDFKKERHLAISLPSAEALRNMCLGAGETIYWSYRSEDKSLMLSAQPYCIIIWTEEVAECDIPDCDGSFDAVSLECANLIRVLQRVKTSGNARVYIDISSDGGMDIYCQDYAVQDFIVGKALARGNADLCVCLPVDTMIAVLKGFQDKEVTISYCVDLDYIVLSSRDDFSAMVYMI